MTPPWANFPIINPSMVQRRLPSAAAMLNTA
jgi:hypothetical protein